MLEADLLVKGPRRSCKLNSLFATAKNEKRRCMQCDLSILSNGVWYSEIFVRMQQNAFVSTHALNARKTRFALPPYPADLAKDPTAPFCFLMDASMLGVGVGFDTKGAETINVMAPGSAEGLKVWDVQVYLAQKQAVEECGDKISWRLNILP